MLRPHVRAGRIQSSVREPYFPFRLCKSLDDGELLRAERAERAATDAYRARPPPYVRISEAPPPPHGRTCATGGSGFMPHAPSSPRVVTR